VIRLGEDAAEIVSTNSLNEAVLASPALSGDALYVRTEKALWKIAGE
jgi:hypothetical protein